MYPIDQDLCSPSETARAIHSPSNPIVDWEQRCHALESQLEACVQQLQQETQTRKQEERWQLAMAGAQDAIWDVNLLTGKSFRSPRWYEIVGYAESEIGDEDQAWVELLHPEDRDRVVSTEQSYLNREIPQLCQEYRIRCKNGTYKWIQVRAQAVWDETGRPVRLVGSNTDITDRKQAELALRQSEERWQLAIQGSQDAVWDHDLITDQIFLSPRCLSMFGYPPEELSTFDQFLKLLHPDDLSILKTAGWRHLNHETDHYECEYRVRCRNGQYRWMRPRGQACWDATGKAVRMVGSITDITDQKQAELERQHFSEALQNANAEMRALFNAMEDLVLVRNAEGICQKVLTPRATHLLYEKPEEMVGRGYDVLPPDVAKQLFRCLKQAIATQQTIYTEYCLPIQGKQTWLSASISRINSEAVVCVARDITQRKLVEDEMQESKEAADLANRSKSEFLANMSHELRTPLTAILGLAEVLQNEMCGELNSKQRSYLDTIAQSGKHLLELINDLLDLAKIESGKMELHLAPTLINDLCEDCLFFVEEQAHQKQIQLQLDVPFDPGCLQADQRRLRQVLINLLSNAVKFTPEGGQVRLEVQPDRHHEVICFSVVDTGIGIAPQHLSQLFQPFMQLDSSLSRRHQGTGLGLALVRRVVELHGGSVSVQSQVDRGSCFTASIPWIPTEPLISEAVVSEDTTSAPVPFSPRVLLVEDNPAILLTLKEYLETNQCQVEMAHTGREAVQKTKHLFPDIILMDVQMPEMDGIEATRRIRSDFRFTELPIVMLSSLIMPGDQERCLAAGATDYLSKPMSLRNVLQVIQQHCHPDRSNPTNSPSPK